jgi:hypothetical protein
MQRLLTIVIAGLLVSGCASRNLLRVDGSGPAVENPEIVEAVNLTVALNPAGVPPNAQLAVCLTPNVLPAECKSSTWHDDLAPANLLSLVGLGEAHSANSKDDVLARERMKLEAALAAFYDPRNDAFGSPADRRDRLQQRLIFASDANCATFAQTIYGTQASSNFIFGGLATSLAGAGAITTNEQTARLLSGLSGIASGLRTEANEDFFRKQWMEAVVKAIDTSRGKMRVDMTTRKDQSISAYPVEAAIADAIRYNGECSLVAGMKEVNAAVTIADDPAGMKAFRNTFRQAGYSVGLSLQDRDGDSDILTDDTLSVERREPASQTADAVLKLDSTIQGVRGRIPALLDKAKADYQTAKNAPMSVKEVAALNVALDAIVAPLDNTAGSAMAPFFHNLEGYATTAATLKAELTKLPAADVDKRSDKLAQIRANDTMAATELTLALHLVNSTDKALQAKAAAP